MPAAPSPTRRSAATAATEAAAHGEGRVADIQRARLLAAAVSVAGELGAASFTVAAVVERAGVSRRTFYEFFRGSEDCLLAAIDYALARARARVLDASSGVQGWPAQLRAAVEALLGFFDEQSAPARLLIVEWLAAGPRALERRRGVLAQVTDAVERGAAQSGRPTTPSSLLAEGVVGGAAGLLHARLLAGTPVRMLELAGPVMSMLVLPHLGAEAARRELERPVSAASSAETVEPVAANPLRNLQIRVTYRTMRVLAALAAQPGASNRMVATAAGVSDQGQISKLLRRLERRGLVQNARSSTLASRGAPNSWTLTSKGQLIERSLRP